MFDLFSAARALIIETRMIAAERQRAVSFPGSKVMFLDSASAIFFFRIIGNRQPKIYEARATSAKDAKMRRTPRAINGRSELDRIYRIMRIVLLKRTCC